MLILHGPHSAGEGPSPEGSEADAQAQRHSDGWSDPMQNLDFVTPPCARFYCDFQE